MATIHLIRTPATPEQINDMLQAFDEFIKLAVDRPHQNNPSMTILDKNIRARVEGIARKLLEHS